MLPCQTGSRKVPAGIDLDGVSGDRFAFEQGDDEFGYVCRR
jgi:hypothetical protein